MGMSINTNVGAMIALQSLSKSTRELEMTQLHVTTGLKVNGPKDDSATFAIAQNMRGDVAGYMAVGTSMAMGESVVSVAIDAAKSIADLLIEMKAKVVQATQDGMDTNSYIALHQDFTALRDQIDTIVNTASFNGKNLIASGATSFNVLSTVVGSTITVSGQSIDPTTLKISSTGAALSNASMAATALLAINTAIIRVSSALAALGASAKRVEIQRDFVGKLTDVLKEGVGNLVDADLAKESAMLNALQVKQQLGVQALSIANSNPQTILALFRG